MPALLRTIQFQGTSAGRSVLDALRFLRELEAEKAPRMRRAPLGVVSTPWRRFVLGANHDVDRRYYTFCTLERLQDALRRRDVFVAPSERWSDPRAKLLHGAGWDTVRTQVCRTLGRGEAAEPELQRLTAELNEAYQRTAAGLSANAAARIERTDGQDRLVLTGLDKIDEPASLVELRALVQALMPRVDLPELLLEVNAWTSFVFGLFWLLGYQFSPRLADIGESRFWRIDRTADYGQLNGLARHRLNTDLIANNWDDVLRVAGSL